MDEISDAEALPAALAAYAGLEGATCEPLGSGLINRTYRVRSGRGDHVLQRVNRVFDPAIHDNIRAVTSRLAERGVPTPRLIDSRSGLPFVDLGPGGLWRLMTMIDGLSFDTVQSPAQARSAGHLVARFHAALEGLPHRFVGLRSGVHDTARHLKALADAVSTRRHHRLLSAVEPLAGAIAGCAAELRPLPDLPPVVAHGDLKFSNVVFAASPGAPATALALVDLDTVAPLPLAYELGDAWRSWCNPRGEDREDAVFDLELFASSLAGYREGRARPFDEAERAAMLGGPEWLSLELAARFGADALLESYFGWDARRFAALGEHNLVRARGQLVLHGALVETRSERRALLAVAG